MDVAAAKALEECIELLVILGAGVLALPKSGPKGLPDVAVVVRRGTQLGIAAERIDDLAREIQAAKGGGYEWVTSPFFLGLTLRKGSSSNPFVQYFSQFRQACAARILPPETEQMIRTWDRRPTSRSRRNTPKWKKVARKPPPDRQRPISDPSRLGAVGITTHLPRIVLADIAVTSAAGY